MGRLESAGSITGYTTTIDYEQVGFDLYFSFTCSARISERSKVVEKVLEIPQVVEATELVTDERTIHVEAVTVENDDITHVADRSTNSTSRSTTRCSSETSGERHSISKGWWTCCRDDR